MQNKMSRLHLLTALLHHVHARWLLIDFKSSKETDYTGWEFRYEGLIFIYYVKVLKETRSYKVSVWEKGEKIFIWTSRWKFLKTVTNNHTPRWMFTAVWIVDWIASPISMWETSHANWHLLGTQDIGSSSATAEWSETVSNKASGDFRMGQHRDEAPVFLHHPIIKEERSTEGQSKNSRS